MSDYALNFSVETREDSRKRMEKGFRSRRNFLISQLFGMIVYGTPVKDGYARGGWYIRFGEDSSGTGPDRPPDKDGSRTVMDALASLRGQSVFKDVVIDNDVHYIDQLEEGYSGQAPDGMVRVALSAFKSMHGDVE